MKRKLLNDLHVNPIIAAINHKDALQNALDSKVSTIFVLKSDIFEVKEIVEIVKQSGKNVFIHIDLIEGLSNDLTGLKYVCEVVKPDGILTTKSQLIKAGKRYGMMMIQRIFMIDSNNFETGVKSVLSCAPDAVEILPGVMPNVTKLFASKVKCPVITGGLVLTKRDMANSLNAGAVGVSTSKMEMWK